MISFSFVLDFT